MTDAEKMGGKFTSYLLSGGLFNPELMDTKAVSELIVECRDVLRSQAAEIERMTSLKDEIPKLIDALDKTTKELERITKTSQRYRTVVKDAVTAKDARIGELEEALRKIDGTATFPVSTEIDPRGYSLHSGNEDRMGFIAETTRAALERT